MKDQQKQLHRKWMMYASSGLILTGMGLCFIVESAYLKHHGAYWATWVLAGTVSLAVFNAGLSVFGQAVVLRIKYLKQRGSLPRN